MELQKVSRRYRIRLLQETDMDDILRLSESNPMFYEYCPPFVTRESILNDMKALPQGKTDAEKYYIGFFEGQNLKWIIRIITGTFLPEKKIKFHFRVRKSKLL